MSNLPKNCDNFTFNLWQFYPQKTFFMLIYMAKKPPELYQIWTGRASLSHLVREAILLNKTAFFERKNSQTEWAGLPFMSFFYNIMFFKGNAFLKCKVNFAYCILQQNKWGSIFFWKKTNLGRGVQVKVLGETNINDKVSTKGHHCMTTFTL